jgi:hypothetical protein
MKLFKLLIFLALSFFTNQALSQPKDSIRYFNQNIFCTSFGIGNYTTLFFNGYEYVVKNNELSLSISTINGLQIQNHQFGIGVSVDKWKEAILFPVFLNYKLNFSRKSLSPYGLINIGYSFGQKYKTQYDDIEKGSFLLKCGAGLQIKLTNKISITADLNYKLQNMLSSYKRIINPNEPSADIKYNIYYNFIGISIGIKF